ncbi:GNAT family N-acetyltransferase [Pontibacter ruber]|uniref:GNAT family N-acetyltransferase n=1 Tax=Pontibacter ruber TaxID=1343895 RepID=A0ABW5D2K6_9BACT|nr:GNAT family N-acetyltransferase [Pontibacter ruber]
MITKDGVPVGCGASREYIAGVTEIKRMHVKAAFRVQDIARQGLAELGKWARTQLNRLYTGNRQEATQSYSALPKNDYTTIPNNSKYEHVDNSVCIKDIR